jgi:hypothetical protein
MLSRVYIFCGCLLVLSGCASTDEAMPQIVYSLSSERPPASPPVRIERPPNHQAVSEDVPGDWLPPSRVEKDWTAIVIHHSATENGNAAIFDRMHREHNHWEGVGYDFVIGNGTDSGDGEVEVTFRWRRQIPGAHCGGTPGNWANEDGIGICLVGNFDRTTPTARQMQALVRLVRFLQQRYKISESRIYGHNSTPGARVTNCPGARFPMSTLKQTLRL